ncbi:hypothetical protein SAMN04488595_109221 [Ralstonia sp. 25mfcol4.1]|nr:hypothetical protein SAMN04488595_109221 [Ralstonia sp. 25mfcol4.1]
MVVMVVHRLFVSSWIFVKYMLNRIFHEVIERLVILFCGNSGLAM